MTPGTILIFLAAALIGSFIQTVSGFGFGIFVMSIFPYFMPSYGEGVAVSTALSLTMTVIIVWKLHKHIIWKWIIPPICSFFVVSAVCITLSAGQDQLLIKLLGGALILMSIYFLFFSGRIHIRPTKINGAIAGGLGGVLGGLFGMGGPPMVVYLLSLSDSNEQYLANIQTYFVITGTFTFLVRVLNGMVTATVLTYWAIGIPILFLGIFIGHKVVKRLNPDNLKKLVYVFMALSGLSMLIK
ncbi:sulfite exporter TauE/SafE family protein [Gehongia tenuis]|uniref:Probable membrane transporter protein n=1 Tax=Gehongia tenuis TaxID=2763655 RepID=A0A926HPM8_9FIRM|nr:sulfite exporter TauE/SafE family protein [Gehongia tenuis]MBC8531829.1 sulfite exporter TauE/SafE family protein [Gehongia tenuis]